MTDSIHISLHTGRNGALPELRAAWRECLDACPPEQQLFAFDWFDAWMGTYGSAAPWTGESRVLVAHTDAGRPCALLPMVVRRSQGLTFLSLAGFYQPLRSFPAVPATAPAAADALARALYRDVPGWDVLRFGPLDDAAPERAALLLALRETARHRVLVPRGRTIVNRLAPSMDAYEPSKTVKRIVDYERRFRKVPGAAIRHVVTPNAGEIAPLLTDLQTIEAHSWLARAGGDLRFGSDCDRAFWTRALETALQRDRHFEAWIASIDGRPLAFRVVLSSGAVDYMIANQYDEAAGEHRLGWILYLEHLRVAVARGTRLIDSAPGDLHYKGRLGGEEAEMRVDAFYFRNSPRGRALTAALGGLHALKGRLERAPWGRRLAARLPRV